MGYRFWQLPQGGEERHGALLSWVKKQAGSKLEISKQAQTDGSQGKNKKVQSLGLWPIPGRRKDIFKKEEKQK